LTKKENKSFDRANPGDSHPIAELAHSMQSLNTSVSSNVKVRLNLWDVEKGSPAARLLAVEKAPVVQQEE
jgi:hypothetical protein